MATAIKAVLTLGQRESFVLHSGSEERVLQSLAEYGLPGHSVPVALGGTLRVSGVAFVRDRLERERGVFNGSITTGPSSSNPGDHEPKFERDEDMIGGFGSSSGASETLTISTATNHIESRLEHEQSNGAQNLVASHNSFPFIPKHHQHCIQNTHPAISSEVENIASSCSALKENNTRGTLPVLYSNVSTGSSHLPVQSMSPGILPQPSIENKDMTGYLPEEENNRKRKKHSDVDNSNKRAINQRTKEAKGNRRKPGASGDPRMNLAVQSKLEDPSLSLVAALLKGGFVFNNFSDSSGQCISNVRDTDNITVYQRRNQLMRRLRKEREKASNAHIAEES